MFAEHRFRNIAKKLDSIVDDGLRYAADRIPIRKLRELTDLDHVCRHVRICNRHLVSQPGHTRAVRSGGRDEDLDVQVLIQRV